LRSSRRSYRFEIAVDDALLMEILNALSNPMKLKEHTMSPISTVISSYADSPELKDSSAGYVSEILIVFLLHTRGKRRPAVYCERTRCQSRG
jgi:hypothetical protein